MRAALLAFTLFAVCNAQTKIVLTNDDGWAVAQVRAEYYALKAAGYDVVLSAPASNKSGTGSSTAEAQPLTSPCEYDSCPTGSPAHGYNATDSRINYVNAYPVDSARYGIQTLSPQFFGSKPDLVISGTNIGLNAGSTTQISGTVGAACEAAIEGIPSVAFSGNSGGQVSYTTLSDTSASSTQSANLYTSLVLKFTAQLLGASLLTPILPANISVNVNFASISSCPSASDYKWVFTRIYADSTATDVETCGSTHLTAESTAVGQGCIATVSVFNATTKSDVDAATQKYVYDKVWPILGCL